MLFATGLSIGASRTPRDVMVKDAAPPGQIGKVFGFVSAGLALGGAIMPVPYGMLIDSGHADLVLVVVAALWLVSLLFAGSARGSPSPDRRRAGPGRITARHALGRIAFRRDCVSPWG